MPPSVESCELVSGLYAVEAAGSAGVRWCESPGCTVISYIVQFAGRFRLPYAAANLLCMRS
jgi:hypothetical protein